MYAKGSYFSFWKTENTFHRFIEFFMIIMYLCKIIYFLHRHLVNYYSHGDIPTRQNRVMFRKRKCFAFDSLRNRGVIIGNEAQGRLLTPPTFSLRIPSLWFRACWLIFQLIQRSALQNRSRFLSFCLIRKS